VVVVAVAVAVAVAVVWTPWSAPWAKCLPGPTVDPTVRMRCLPRPRR
jgi:hypothetical protein